MGVDGQAAAGRWSVERTTAWAHATPWLVGFNFLPSTAVNFLEMWRGETFDPETIDRELGWAAAIGFNALRTNLHYLDWAHDRDGLIARIDRFLGIAATHRLHVMLCLFDDCEFSGETPFWGAQPAPRPGIHNSRALGSPGRAAVRDRSQWPRFRAYVQDVIGAFDRDARVSVWDLYNEPGNRMIFDLDVQREHDPSLEPDSRELMRACFAWAREVGPDQPLTVAPWRLNPVTEAGAPSYWHPIDLEAVAFSDVISFHAYCGLDRMMRVVEDLAAQGRPLLCTEWMARGVGSRIDDQLPFLRARGVGAFQWGLVKGRTQTHLPWPGVVTARATDAEEWFHDLLAEDGAPHSPGELALIASIRASGARAETRDAALADA
jgi:hypothetical protein